MNNHFMPPDQGLDDKQRVNTSTRNSNDLCNRDRDVIISMPDSSDDIHTNKQEAQRSTTSGTKEFNELNLLGNEQKNEQKISNNTTVLENSVRIDLACRICYEGEDKEIFVSPCNCTGSLSVVHKSCMERWLNETQGEKCELCCTNIPIRRTSKSLLEYFRGTHSNGFYNRAMFNFCVFFVFTSGIISITPVYVNEIKNYFRADNNLLHGIGNEVWNSTLPDISSAYTFNLKSNLPDIIDESLLESNTTVSGKANKGPYEDVNTTPGLLTIGSGLQLLHLFWLYHCLKYHIKHFLTWRNRNGIIRINLKK